MNFGVWHSMDDAPAAAPDSPGVFQARADTVLPYPRGRSAMVLYARSRDGETLRRTFAGAGDPAIGRAARAGARLVRFAAADAPTVELARLLQRFVDRFGAPPVANASADADPAADEPNDKPREDRTHG